MTEKLATLKAALEKALGDRVQSLTKSIGELTLVVKAADYYDVMRTLRDDASLKFEQLIDLCGVDYACLLYTSPSPRDLSTSRMPSSA